MPPPSIRRLESILIQDKATSALIPADPSLKTVYRPVALFAQDREEEALHSETPESSASNILFTSPVSNISLQAGLIQLDRGTRGSEFLMAWAAEDISLNKPYSPPPYSWPLPQWNMAPLEAKPAHESIRAPEETSWIPSEQSLPFTPDESPALVPVIQSLVLKFGIFASGKSGTREKVVKIRYFLEGSLWNPYNRALTLHDGSGLRPVFSIAWWHLPMLRIRNLTRGNQTGWLSIDTSINSGTGAHGIHGWIRAKGTIAPGETVHFSEPDSKWQPEGLARTLHPGFAVGPGDHVVVEYKPREQGIHAACLVEDIPQPVEAAQAGKGWFRMEGFPNTWTSQRFERADDLPRPFYLYEGSLSFRMENTHWQVSFARTALSTSGEVDPRRRALNDNRSFEDAAGNTVKESSLADLSVQNLLEDIPMESASVNHPPILSWPSSKPESLLTLSDLPGWAEGFRLGSKGAKRINQILDEPANWPTHIYNSTTIEKTLSTGEKRLFHQSFPVNHLSPEGWQAQFMRSVIDEPAVFARYPTIADSRSADTEHRSPDQLAEVASEVAELIRGQPASSVSEFFNRGLLEAAFTPSLSASPINRLMPLRGWMRNGLPLRRRGSAWILHIAVQVEEDRHPFQVAARIWLQEILSSKDETTFAVIRFEWVPQS